MNTKFHFSFPIFFRGRLLAMSKNISKNIQIVYMYFICGIYQRKEKKNAILRIVSARGIFSRRKIYIHAFSKFHLTFSFSLRECAHGNIPFPPEYVMLQEVKSSLRSRTQIVCVILTSGHKLLSGRLHIPFHFCIISVYSSVTGIDIMLLLFL